jgi:Tfp pilus assembly protein PilO
MTDTSHGMALVRRAATEHRPVILTLVAGLAVNLVAYGIVVYPLAQRVANVTQRDSAAERALAQAKADYAQASGTLSGKARASTELTTFYNDVLPKDLSGARRLTYLRLAQLARESNLRFESGSYKPEEERDSTLTRLKIQLVLGGSYADIRTFIHSLEASPEFVVIDNVELAEGAEGGNLAVTLELSTYYRNAAVS